MVPSAFLWSPFCTQVILMGLDEFFFHRRRGLPKWEILSHPSDTLATLCCIVFLLRAGPTPHNLGIFVALCVVSALLATKDEFVHLDRCSRGEQWLHSVLFMLHPTVFFCSGIFWWSGGPPLYLQLQAGLISVFFVYQIVYWGKPWRVLRSTTASAPPTMIQ